MAKFILSAFADEASASLDEQIATLKALGISHMRASAYVERRGMYTDLTEEAAKAVRKKLDDAGIGLSSIGSPASARSILRATWTSTLKSSKNTINVANILVRKVHPHVLVSSYP